MTSLLVIAGAAAAGMGSALIPVVNAEAYALASAGTISNEPLLVLVVVALALGQTVGKAILFEAGRRGTGRWLDRVRRKDSGRGERRWAGRVASRLSSARYGPPILLASAAVGVPPLAVTSIVAGACGQRRRLFLPICLVGRTVRFLVLVLPLAHFVR